MMADEQPRICLHGGEGVNIAVFFRIAVGDVLLFFLYRTRSHQLGLCPGEARSNSSR